MRETIVREEPPPGVPPSWDGAVAGATYRPRRRPLQALLRLIFALFAIAFNAIIAVILVDQLAPELHLKYQALKLFRWVGYAFEWSAWWARRRGRG